MNLTVAKTILTQAKSLLQKVTENLAGSCEENGRLSVTKLDERQVAAYDYSYMVAELTAAEAALAALEKQKSKNQDVTLEESLTHIALAEAIHHIFDGLYKRLVEYGLTEKDLESFHEKGIADFLQEGLASQTYEKVAALILSKYSTGASHWLDEQHGMFRDTFKKFAETEIMPLAEKVHREDLLVPEGLIQKVSEMGCFGISLPQKYGGFQDDEKPDHIGMVVVTEELARGALAIGGSLITRPEILAKALLKGGTEEQKQAWLPKLASGERMVAIAATEPDYGSDVAQMKVAATKTEGGWLLNGCKTWCTFAGYADSLLVLARTHPDMSLKHKGLSLLIAEKPRFTGHEFEHTQDGGGKISGRAIDTIGYRGLHSFELFFDNYFVPDQNLVGGEDGLGKGFYLQMEGFSGGRLQTAARALGVMQAAFEAACKYAQDRKVFSQPISNYQLTRYKLARMATLIHANRQFTYHVAHLMGEGKGQVEASLVKFYASRMSEWVTREAMQIHGGMGYAEEFAVSRYFVDARVFSIFEGAEETLVLRVVARGLLEKALKAKAA